MHKDEIADLLEEKYHTLINWLEGQDHEKWTQGPNGEWTTGQQALYLLQSIIPLNNALSMPKFLLRYRFGKTNRKARDYDTIVRLYLEHLKDAEGNTFKGSRKMKTSTLEDKTYILTRLQVESKKLQYKARKITDENLDTLLLPHPFMGKISIREILMCNAYHVEYRTKTLTENY
ncbi:hypothetical protein LX77_00747 [Gelidibacter algens]|uniref:DinB family protein n=1 Tax=Gelidibacter algens TaxID=49280 RepID=A0A1A7R644_9FLAO|nr:hypothetical protein [Gelidibacter algens]OBX26944.1 hypothetical protein A9996_02455 [Gelidibacter algens]RAJ26498.1 hypothetical protein LX77_00747 [Gelidibacter algens]